MQIYVFYILLSITEQAMLQYREFLLQSRANRLSSQLAAHSHHAHSDQHSHQSPHSRHSPHQPHPRGSSHKSHESIKQLVSQPNYGEIFYSDSGKKVTNNAQRLKIVSKEHKVDKNNKSHNEELSRYLGELEKENNELKQRLSQGQRNGDPRNSQPQAKQSRQKMPSGFQQQGYERVQNDYGHGFDVDAQQDPMFPQKSFQRKNKQHYHNHENNQNGYHPHPHSPHHYQQETPHYHQPHNSNYYQNGKKDFYEFQNYHEPQFGIAKYPEDIQRLARQKLSQLKDDDEELRQYSVQVLRRPI